MKLRQTSMAAVSGLALLMGLLDGTLSANAAVRQPTAGSEWPLAGPIFRSLSELSPNGAQPGDFVGASLVGDGRTVAAGATNSNGADTARGYTGAVYVWDRRSGDNWGQADRIVAPDGAPGDQFGNAVALDRDTLVVGAPGRAGQAGAVYVFRRDGRNWYERQRIDDPANAAGDNFGNAVGLADDTVAVGAPGAAGGAGVVYVFKSAGDRLVEQQAIASPAGQNFGSALAIENDRLVASEYGTVFVFDRRPRGFRQTATLTGAGASSEFGVSVAVGGDTVVVGARRENTPAGQSSGAVYVFARRAGGWTQQQRLTAPDEGFASSFGSGVGVHGGVLVVGAFLAPGLNTDGNVQHNTGEGYVFQRSGQTWSLVQKVVAPDGAAFDAFGGAVALSRDGRTALFSAPRKANGTGAVYAATP